MAVYTFLAGVNGTSAGTVGDDTFIWPAAGGSIDTGDTFFGGAGTDTLRMDGAAALNFSGAFAGQWMAGIERIVVNFSIYDANIDDFLGASVTIGGAAGAPEGGVITMIGGDGGDVFDISARAAGYNGTFDGGGGGDVFRGGGGNDRFVAGTGFDAFAGGGGDDTVSFLQTGFDGFDTINGGSGIDTLRLTGAAPISLTLGILPVTSMEVIDLSGFSAAVTVTGLAGYLSAAETLTVLGGAGNDRFDFAAAGYAVVAMGGAGADSFVGGSGADVFRPGSGADTFFGGNDARNTLEIALSDLGSGDVFNGGGSGYAHMLRLTTGGTLTAAALSHLERFTVLELGPGGIALTLRAVLPVDNVALQGGTGGDRIDARGLPQQALLEGNGGNDTLFGSNVLALSDGFFFSDYLWGGVGNDRIYGLAGDDSINGGDNDDWLDGGAGADYLEDGSGNDRMLGGAGGDSFRLGQGADTLLGGAGTDIVEAPFANLDALDRLDGGAGYDLLKLSLLGGGNGLSLQAAQRITGFEEATVSSESVNTSIVLSDAMVGSVQAGSIFTIRSISISAATVEIDGRAVTAGGFRAYTQDTNDILRGGAGGDTLESGNGVNLVEGNDGDDVLIQRAVPFLGAVFGADTFSGGNGDDTLLLVLNPFGAFSDLTLTDFMGVSVYQGGAGTDTLRLSGTTGVSVTETILSRFAGFEVLELPDAFNDVLLTNAALPAGTTAFTVQGGSDTDLLDGRATTLPLRLFGGAGDDELQGGSGNDLLDAGAGTDYVIAGAGNDTVHFYDVDGDDFAEGGTGADQLFLYMPFTNATPSTFANFTGFESLALSMDGGRAVLPAGFTAAVGAGVFVVDLYTASAGPGGIFAAPSVTTRLDIRGGSGAETITGGRGADVIRDSFGADCLQGGGGADLLVLAADGAADRVVYGSAGVGSRDIAAATGPGLLAQADTISGFNGAGDPGNLLEFIRSGFLGLGNKSQILSVAAGGAVDLSAGAVFVIDSADVVAGGLADRARIDAAFGNRIAAGDAGHAGFVIARGPAGMDAGLYYVRDSDGLAGISNDDQLHLLAVLTSPGAITASEISLI